MKTKLTINDIKILLDNKINVCAYGGILNLMIKRPNVFIPYIKEGNFRENLVALLKKLNYKYIDDTHYPARDCEVLILETDGDISREVFKLRAEYDTKLLTVGGVIW